jgi:hypothetical protein
VGAVDGLHLGRRVPPRVQQEAAVDFGGVVRGMPRNAISNGLGILVCDVVLFNAGMGHLLVVEAKSGANIEEDQARKLAVIDPLVPVIAGGFTIPQTVQL